MNVIRLNDKKYSPVFCYFKQKGSNMYADLYPYKMGTSEAEKPDVNPSKPLDSLYAPNMIIRPKSVVK